MPPKKLKFQDLAAILAAILNFQKKIVDNIFVLPNAIIQFNFTVFHEKNSVKINKTRENCVNIQIWRPYWPPFCFFEFFFQLNFCKLLVVNDLLYLDSFSKSNFRFK